MGNLYTKVIKIPNRRIEILAELKLLWRNRPVDIKKINKLKDELQKIETNQKKRKASHTKKLSGFELGYQSRLRDEKMKKAAN